MPADKGVNRMKIRNLCIFAAMLLAAATVLPVCAADVAANGDLNADGVCSAADAVLLRKWLLCIPETVLPVPSAGDMNADGSLNAADLTLLKRIL